MWNSLLKCIVFCACLQVCEYIKIIDLAEKSSALAVFNLSGFVSQYKAILFTENTNNNEFVYMSMREKSFTCFFFSSALHFYYHGY